VPSWREAARSIAGAENVAEAASAPAVRLLPSNRRRDNARVNIWFLDIEKTSCVQPKGTVDRSDRSGHARISHEEKLATLPLETAIDEGERRNGAKRVAIQLGVWIP
jgi:hypothetical protein